MDKRKQYPVVPCTYCGRPVRALDQRQYPEYALCYKCLKDPSITGVDKSNG